METISHNYFLPHCSVITLSSIKLAKKRFFPLASREMIKNGSSNGYVVSENDGDFGSVATRGDSKSNVLIRGLLASQVTGSCFEWKPKLRVHYEKSVCDNPEALARLFSWSSALPLPERVRQITELVWEKISDPESIAEILKQVYTDHSTNVEVSEVVDYLIRGWIAFDGLEAFPLLEDSIKDWEQYSRVAGEIEFPIEGWKEAVNMLLYGRKYSFWSGIGESFKFTFIRTSLRK